MNVIAQGSRAQSRSSRRNGLIRAPPFGFPWPAPPRLTAAAIIALGAGATLVLYFPGQLSYDSVAQLAEGREGVYGGVHPPVMSWLLGLADAVRPGAALFVVFDTVLIAGALMALVLLARRPSWPSTLLAGVLAAIPQLLIFPAIVWKDVLFAATATAGFASLAQAAVWWRGAAKRFALLALALVLLTLAALARQNGAVVLPFGAAAAGWIAAVAKGPAPRCRGWIHGIGFLAAGAASIMIAAAALNARTEAGGALGQQWESLQTYDIVGAISLDPRLDLRVLASRSPWLERLLETDGAAAYSPIRINGLGPTLDRMTARPQSARIVAEQWAEIIRLHPLLYLRVRARAFEWVFLTPVIGDCVPVYTGLDGPPEEMGSLGLSRRQTNMDRALARYALAFTLTPVYAHAIYGAVGVVLLIGLLRRRRAPDIAVAAMLASAIAFALSFAVISIACDYRYLYYLDLAVIAAALYAAATWPGGPIAPRPEPPDRAGFFVKRARE